MKVLVGKLFFNVRASLLQTWSLMDKAANAINSALLAENPNICNVNFKCDADNLNGFEDDPWNENVSCLWRLISLARVVGIMNIRHCAPISALPFYWDEN